MTKIKSGSQVTAFVHANVGYINNDAFNGLPPAKKTEVISTVFAGGGQSLEFLDNFRRFTDKKAILRAIGLGVDVSAALAFLEIQIPEEQVKRFVAAQIEYSSALKPIEEAVNGVIPPYPFADIPDNPRHLTLTQNDKRVANGNNGHSVTIGSAKKLFTSAAKHWLSGSNSTKHLGYASYDGYNRSPEITPTSLVIGCQTIPRYAIEQFALSQGWDFPQE